jgi:hypothetical protein
MGMMQTERLDRRFRAPATMAEIKHRDRVVIAKVAFCWQMIHILTGR